jgi:hypothetical protein
VIFMIFSSRENCFFGVERMLAGLAVPEQGRACM